jgi:tetratricopeptide (TPR) repeat protein
MHPALLLIGLLFVVNFSLATWLEPHFQNWSGSRTQSGNLMQVALGDGRKLFARHAFTRADVYFHSGYYPSIYDGREDFDKAHSGQKSDAKEYDFLGEPRDWIDRFNRNFFPSRHTHLGDAKCGDNCCQQAKHGDGHSENCEHKDHDHHASHEAQDPTVDGREILPWIRLAAELDPERVETFVVGSFWLRNSLQKPQEAEQFLREGLRANPGEPSILLELGRLYNEVHNDAGRARNVFELALSRWRQREAGKPEPDSFLHEQILIQLADLERKQTNIVRAVEYFTELKTVSPKKESIQLWIDYLKTNGPAAASSPWLR